MTYAELFDELKGKFKGADVSDIKEHLAFQFNIEDEAAGGIFYVEVKEGELYVEPYDYHDRDAMFICTPEVLLKIADGKMDPVAAFTEQKLRVEGNLDKAVRLGEIIKMKKAAAQSEKAPTQSEKAAAQSEKAPTQSEKAPTQSEKAAAQSEKAPTQSKSAAPAQAVNKQNGRKAADKRNKRSNKRK